MIIYPSQATFADDVDLMNRRAPADDLLRDLAALVRWYRRGQPIKGVPKYLHGIEADKALARVDAHLEGREPQALARAGGDLLSAISVVALLKLARGRMQHIVETAATAMTPAEVRMTRDLIAQIDAAFNHPDPEPPKEDGRGD